MADLIDRDALMKEICGNECGSVCDEECENVFCNFYDYIMDAPAVNRWIPVEDALPEIGYSVLVTRQTESNTRYVRIASRQDDCWMDNTDKYGKPNPHQVIAWMPMPDAYEQTEKEDET
jgi:hypothetical protein